MYFQSVVCCAYMYSMCQKKQRRSYGHGTGGSPEWNGTFHNSLISEFLLHSGWDACAKRVWDRAMIDCVPDWSLCCEEGESAQLHVCCTTKALLRYWVLVDMNEVVNVAHCTCMAGLAETCWGNIALGCTCTRTYTKWHSLHLKGEWLVDAYSSPKHPLHVHFCTWSCVTLTRKGNRCNMNHYRPRQVFVGLHYIMLFMPLIFFLMLKRFFGKELAKRNKKPNVLSVVEPFTSDFALSSDHLPLLLNTIFQPKNHDLISSN